MRQKGHFNATKPRHLPISPTMPSSPHSLTACREKKAPTRHESQLRAYYTVDRTNSNAGTHCAIHQGECAPHPFISKREFTRCAMSELQAPTGFGEKGRVGGSMGTGPNDSRRSRVQGAASAARNGPITWRWACCGKCVFGRGRAFEIYKWLNRMGDFGMWGGQPRKGFLACLADYSRILFCEDVGTASRPRNRDHQEPRLQGTQFFPWFCFSQACLCLCPSRPDSGLPMPR